MGLDVVEFVLDVEKTFHFRFPDEDLILLTTPRRLIDYLVERLPTAAKYVCPSQRVFYRLRSAVANQLQCPRSALRPNTSLLALIPADARYSVWEQVHQDFASPKITHWPRLDDASWLDCFRSRRIATLREATQFLVARLPGAAKVVNGHEAGWTREEVAEEVHRLIQANFAIPRQAYTEDSRWAEDVGFD